MDLESAEAPREGGRQSKLGFFGRPLSPLENLIHGIPVLPELTKQLRSVRVLRRAHQHDAVPEVLKSIIEAGEVEFDLVLHACIVLDGGTGVKLSLRVFPR